MFILIFFYLCTYVLTDGNFTPHNFHTELFLLVFIIQSSLKYLLHIKLLNWKKDKIQTAAVAATTAMKARGENALSTKIKRQKKLLC